MMMMNLVVWWDVGGNLYLGGEPFAIPCMGDVCLGGACGRPDCCMMGSSPEKAGLDNPGEQFR